MDVSWKNLDIEVPNNNKNIPDKFAHLIKNSSGFARKGKILAIMGPSGSGKTTLLKTLVGRIPPGSRTKGVIYGDGNERTIREWIKRSAYVDQDDSVYEHLTVYETILYAAKFRCEDKSSDLEKKVKNILTELKIQNIAHNKMNSISGGERKRAMIAVELVSDPDLIFLDEPTSGLDTYIAISFVNLLKEYALNNKKTIILTIHQPPQEAFGLFDDLLLLSKGETVYCGKASECENFFNDYNFTRRLNSPFSDFILEILFTESVENKNIKIMIDKMSNKFGEDSNVLNNKIKTNNDIFVDYNVNFNHTRLLVSRRLKLYNFDRKKIVGYLKRLFFIGIGYYLVKNYWNDAELANDFLKNNNIDTINLKYILDLNYGYNMLRFVELFISYSAFFMYNNCGDTIFSIFGEYKNVRRELGVFTYSTSSYYLSIFLLELMEQFTFNILYVSILYIFIKKPINWIYFIFMSLGSIIILPPYLFFGVLSKNVKVLYCLSLISMCFSIVPTFLIAFYSNKDLSNIFLNNLIRYLRVLVLFWNPTYYILFSGHFISKYIISSLNISDKAAEKIQESGLREILDRIETFIPKITLHISIIGVLTLISFLGVVLLGVFTLGRLLRPDFRMKLS